MTWYAFITGLVCGAAIALIWLYDRAESFRLQIEHWRDSSRDWQKAFYEESERFDSMYQDQQPRDKKGRFISRTTLMTEQLKRELKP